MPQSGFVQQVMEALLEWVSIVFDLHPAPSPGTKSPDDKIILDDDNKGF